MKMRILPPPPLPGNPKSLFDGLRGSWWVEFTEGDLPQRVLLRLATSPEGTIICTGLIVGAFPPEEEISARDLRSIRLGEILSNLGNLLEAHKEFKRKGELKNLAEFRRVTIGDMLEASVDYIVRPTTLRPGPKGQPREHFEDVAKAYRAALISDPRRPVKRLAEQYHASGATVRRWIQRARDMGLLGESVPGKAGEVKPRRKR